MTISHEHADATAHDPETANDIETDTEARIASMTDTLAAGLYWHEHGSGSWEQRRRLASLHDHAERLVADNRNPTPEEIDLIAENWHREVDDNRDLRSWIRDRKILGWFGHRGSDAISEAKLMRVGDIVATVAATTIGLVVLRGLGLLGGLLLDFLTSFM